GDHKVERLGLVPDLVREPALAPRLDLAPGAFALLDDVLDAIDDLAVSLLGDLRLDQQHDLVSFDPDHLPRTDGGPGVPGAAIRISGGAVPWQEAVRLCAAEYTRDPDASSQVVHRRSGCCRGSAGRGAQGVRAIAVAGGRRRRP